MITKRAIRLFLERDRADFRRYKKHDNSTLSSMVMGLPVRPPIWNKLRKEQRACFLIGAQLHRFCFFLDTGLGKSLLSIALARYLKKAGIAKRFLVLVPNRVNTGEWLRECKKHKPSATITVLAGPSANKWEKLEASDSTLVITTYAGLMRMVSEMVPVTKGRKKGHDKLKPSPKLMRRLLAQVDGLIMDESTAVQTRSKLPFRICRQISKQAKAVFALTGTPFGRDPTPLWAQLYLVDGGQTLGETLGLFRAVFFRSTENYWGGQDHVFDTKKERLLHRCLAARSIRYEAEESTLPKVVPIIKELHLPQDANAYYAQARKMLVESHGNYKEQKNAFLRMRQISSGYLGYFDDEEGKRAQFSFEPNPKLEMLLSLITSIREDKKILVFHDFTFSGTLICRELEKLKIDHERLYGGTKDAEAAVKRFITDKKCRVFVVNNKAGAFGGNWQVAQYGIYYESPVSAIIRRQTERRWERQYSEHAKVFRYDLVVRGTVDQDILNFHSEGQSLFDAIIEGKARI